MDIPEAEAQFKGIITQYQTLGYSHCRFLAPNELLAIDKDLQYFYEDNTWIDNKEQTHWNNGIAWL